MSKHRHKKAALRARSGRRAAPPRNDVPAQGRGISRRAFLAANVLAVLIAAALVVLPRASEPVEAVRLPSSQRAVADGTTLGSPVAPVTVTVYTEFQCPSCQSLALTTEKEIRDAYVETGQVRLVYRHFIVYDEESVQAAIAAEAAAEQNRFWEYHDLLMAVRASGEADDLTTERLQSLAQKAGLDMDAFNASFLAGRHRDKVEQDEEDGRAQGVRGTPTFLISGGEGDDRVTLTREGGITFAEFQQLVAPLLDESGAE